MAKKAASIPTDEAKPETTAETTVETPEVPVSTAPVDTEVTPETEAELSEPVSLDRDQTIEEMAKRRAESRKPQETAPDTETPPVGSEGDGNETPPVLTDDDDDDDPEMVTIKVNGKNVQVTQAEVDAAGGIVAIQKQRSADEKLRQAAEERKQIEKDKELLNQALTENQQFREELSDLRKLIQGVAPDGKTRAPASSEEIKQRAAEMTNKFFTGDGEQLQTVFENILAAADRPAAQAQAQKPVDEDALVQRIASQVEQDLEFERERKQALKNYAKNHPDLQSSPGRTQWVNEETKALLREHANDPDWGPQEILEEAVKITREKYNLPAPKAPEKDPNDLDTRTTRKRSTVDRVQQASARAAIPSKEFKPKTKSQIFEEVQAQRSHR